jgi:hypothetical protein
LGVHQLALKGIDPAFPLELISQETSTLRAHDDPSLLAAQASRVVDARHVAIKQLIFGRIMSTTWSWDCRPTERSGRVFAPDRIILQSMASQSHWLEIAIMSMLGALWCPGAHTPAAGAGGLQLEKPSAPPSFSA